MAKPGDFLDPKSIWLAIGVATLLLIGLRSYEPTPQAPGEPVALLNIGQGDSARVEKIVQRDCVRQGGRVWVAFEDGVECLAFVRSSQESATDIGLVFLDGDVPDAQWQEASAAAAGARYKEMADAAAARYGVPVVVVGRPGIMGSTGFHKAGGRSDEGKVMNAAMDALKAKLGVRRLALAGQSGGARIIAQVMVLGRADIVCAAMASGAYDVPRVKSGGTVGTNIFGNPGRGYIVPLLRADGVVAAPARRSYVIGDPRDTISDFPEQRAWADKLAALGHHVELIETGGSGGEHHGLAGQAIRAAAVCAAGGSDAAVRAAVLAR